MFDTEFLFSFKGVAFSLFSASVAIIIKNWIRMVFYFRGRNIPGPMPLPILGSSYKLASLGLIGMDNELIEKYGKTVGLFEGSTPVILSTDVNLIKNVLIKEFHNFTNRRVFESSSIKPLDKTLLVLKDEEWKRVRTAVTSAFSSGKLKLMMKCLDMCSQNFMEFAEELVQQKDGILDTEVFGNYTLDVICTCCFGVDTDSIKNPNNEFTANLKKVMAISLKSPSMLLALFIPGLARKLIDANLMTLFDAKSLGYLEETMKGVIEMRKSKKTVLLASKNESAILPSWYFKKRVDFIQLVLDIPDEYKDPAILETEKSEEAADKARMKKTLTDAEILSQCLIFVFGGYETTMNAIKHSAYHLATHPEWQEKVITQLDKVLDNHDGKINYESVNEMTYLEMTINESVRLFPPAPRVDRVASSDYEYDNIKIKKGEVFTVPIYALHHDPNVFPDPDEFKPERFFDENKKQRENVAFMGFGAGPRNCGGLRFAHLEMKLLLTKILSKYKFERCDKTVKKIEIDKAGTRTQTKGPIIVKLSER